MGNLSGRWRRRRRRRQRPWRGRGPATKPLICPDPWPYYCLPSRKRGDSTYYMCSLQQVMIQENGAMEHSTHLRFCIADMHLRREPFQRSGSGSFQEDVSGDKSEQVECERRMPSFARIHCCRKQGDIRITFVTGKTGKRRVAEEHSTQSRFCVADTPWESCCGYNHRDG